MNWLQYTNDNFGFAMIIPQGANLQGHDLGGGWASLHVNVGGGVDVLAIGKLGTWASPEEIEAYGIQVTGVPAAAWSLVEQGTNSNGWNWYRTYTAQAAGALVFVVLGVGPRGSYLCLVKTSAADFLQNRALYNQWYSSLRLY